MPLHHDPYANVLILPCDLSESDEPLVNTADVLRQIRARRPKALMVWLDANDLEARAELISEIHQRCPQMTLIALADNHDEQSERAARVAGASYYFPLTNENDHRHLETALSELGIQLSASATGEHTGLSPPRRASRQPRSRASPAQPPPTPQARGRPPRLFRR